MTVQTNVLSSPYQPIALSDIAARMPSIFQTEAHESRSENYAQVTTAQVLARAVENGFSIHAASEARVRLDHKRGFQKHMLRLRHSSANLGERRAPEIILLNSHDGASGFRIISGLLEFACLNGIITGARFESFSIRHSGDAVNNVVNSMFRVMAELPRLAETVHAMQSRVLSVADQMEFAERAIAARFGENVVPFSPLQINTARRAEDANATLWSTFQRVQENITQGGARARVIGNNGRARATTLRRVKAIDANVSLNRELWDIADTYIDRTPKPMIAADYTVAA